MMPGHRRHEREAAQSESARPRNGDSQPAKTGPIRKALEREGRGMPWLGKMALRIEEWAGGQRLIVHQKTALGMLLTAKTLMRWINRIIARSAPSINQVVMTAEPVQLGRKRNGTMKTYRPVIKWRVNATDRRVKRVPAHVTRDFLEHAWSDQYARGVLGETSDEQKQLLKDVFDAGAMQERAIGRMICHLARTDLVVCKNGVLDLGCLDEAESREGIRNQYPGFLTRYQVLEIMKELGLLKLPTDRQRHAYWPRMESLPSMPGDQALVLLCSLTGHDIETMKGPSRTAEIAYYRHLIMSILYRTSNKTLLQVAEALGRTDHTTARNAILRINAYSRRWPGHAEVVDHLCDLIDSLGVFMVKCRQLNVDEGFTINRTADGRVFMIIHALAHTAESPSDRSDPQHRGDTTAWC